MSGERQNQQKSYEQEYRRRRVRQEVGRRRMSARRRKIRKIKRICKLAIAVIVIILLVCVMISLLMPSGKESRETSAAGNRKEETSTQEEVSTVPMKVDSPVVREYDEIIIRLKELSQKDKTIKAIYKEREEYPEEVLASVANNPEMAEFVAGYLTEPAKVNGGIRKTEKKQKFPLFLQWDKRWGYVSYGDSNIGMAGCGPTCLSMVAYALTKNEDITPDAVASYSEENGFYVEGTGTAWALMTEGAAHFGIDGYEISLSEEVMKNHIGEGHMLICAVGAGDFTTSGHFIVIYDYDENGFYVNDPNCKYRSGKTWDYETLQGQIRNLWAFETTG